MILMKHLDDYRGIVSDSILEEIREKGQVLSDATFVHVNATNLGGGVAEILDNMVLLMNDVGIRTDWRVLHGTPEFFEVTKKFHNALQGQDIVFSDNELNLYRFVNEKFSQFALLDHDLVIIHDPQPLALVHYVNHSSPWVWRCHIDITDPNKEAWGFVEPFILEYDRMIVSAERYLREDLAIQQQIIQPSIDPLSPKNMELSHETIEQYLAKEKIPIDKPMITQVSRFDPWKDPEGVLKVYEVVRKEVDCRLVFCYNMANDDPEGMRIYNQMLQTAKSYLERGDVLFVRGDDPVLVNVLQRYSSVIVQKSTREGFGLVVTEALWKETPIVASNIGGIPNQIQDGVTGFLVDPTDISGCAERVLQLLDDPDMSAEMGRRAKESVQKKFLITRHMLDYMNLALDMLT